MGTTRRGFLQLLGLGAATVAVEPVRRFWQVGTQLVRPTTEEVVAINRKAPGFRPVEGQPGLFVDATGRIVSIRDFNESAMYSTLVLPPPPYEKPISMPRTLQMLRASDAVMQSQLHTALEDYKLGKS
jgi:hypothetical protein